MVIGCSPPMHKSIDPFYEGKVRVRLFLCHGYLNTELVSYTLQICVCRNRRLAIPLMNLMEQKLLVFTAEE